jgi:hypothetical protein
MSGKTKTNLYIDISIFILFLVLMEPALTGLAIHEWLGLASGVALLTHLLLHWKWVVAVVLRFFRELPASSRFNFVLNTALLTTFTLVIVSGLMISTTLGIPQLLGIAGDAGQGWAGVHHTTSDLSMLLVGLHVAVHWNWIINAFKRYILRRQLQQSRTAAPSLSTQMATETE